MKMLTTSKLMLIVLPIATVLLVVRYPNLSLEPFGYGVVIESGSTVSRIHVYGYEVAYGKPISELRVRNYTYGKLSPSLLAYADDPDEASVSLTKLVEMVKLRIPKRMWKKTQVRLITTSAGTRLLQKHVTGKFFHVTQKVLKSSGFMFRAEWANRFSNPGSEDIVNAWVVTDLALRSLGGHPLHIKYVAEVIEASPETEIVFSHNRSQLFPIPVKAIKEYPLVTIMVLILVVMLSRKMFTILG